VKRYHALTATHPRVQTIKSSIWITQLIQDFNTLLISNPVQDCSEFGNFVITLIWWYCWYETSVLDWIGVVYWNPELIEWFILTIWSFVLVGELLLMHDNASLIVLERNTFWLFLSVVHFPLSKWRLNFDPKTNFQTNYLLYQIDNAFVPFFSFSS
jgi:hypothetical protein